MVFTRDFLPVDFLAIDSSPGVNDICQDERNEEADISHGAQCKLTAAAVGYRQAALQVCIGRIVCRIVPSSA